MTQDTVQEIEKNIQEARKLVELDKCLERLHQNQDFKKVVLEGYLIHEAVRLVHLKADPAFQTPERQASVLVQIDAIGGLVGYFRKVEQQASLALKAIAADEETRDEILAEGDAK